MFYYPVLTNSFVANPVWTRHFTVHMLHMSQQATACLNTHVLSSTCVFDACFLVFQVISGGNYDVDCFVTDPHNSILYNERKKQYDSFSHTTAMKGVYQVCFSNEFSTFTHKTVYLDFRHGDEKPLMPSMTSSTAMTQVSLRSFSHLKSKVLTIEKDTTVAVILLLKSAHLKCPEDNKITYVARD